MMAMRIDPATGRGDLCRDPDTGAVLLDHTFATAVELSLFSDARAPEGLAGLPDPDFRSGWWGDGVAESDPALRLDKYGSLLWTRTRSKLTAQVFAEVRDFAEDALAWLKEDEAAETVSASARRVDGNVALTIQITRPNGADRWASTWEQTLALP